MDTIMPTELHLQVVVAVKVLKEHKGYKDLEVKAHRELLVVKALKAYNLHKAQLVLRVYKV